MNAISVIVPTLNEADNITMLIERIAAGFEASQTTYEILFVDDNSIDGTRDVINSFAEKYPVKVMVKKGPRGKAYSLLEGFEAARYDLLCMIDADLQYPPEAIVPMHQLMMQSGTDIVLTNRQEHGTSALRKLTSAGFNLVFTKMMFGFDYDSQSGLKLFKREVIENISLDPTPWSFDLEFIVRSLEQNYKIVSYDITFAERYAGVAKIQVGKVAYELAKASVKLRLNSSPSKVKSAYKTSNNIAKKTVMASLAIFALLGSSLFVAATPAAGLALTDTATLAKLQPADKNKDDKDKDKEEETKAVENKEAEEEKQSSPIPTEPSVAPVAPLTVQQPTPPQVASQPAAKTLKTQPSAATSRPQSPAVKRVNRTGNNATVTKQESLPATTKTAAPANPTDKSGLATYPDGTKKTGGFSYTEDTPTAAAGLVKPLSVAALVIALISVGAYLFSTHPKNIKFYGNSQAIKG